jgi:hypothetical protein
MPEMGNERVTASPLHGFRWIIFLVIEKENEQPTKCWKRGELEKTSIIVAGIGHGAGLR